VRREFAHVEGWIGRVVAIGPTGTGTVRFRLWLFPSGPWLSTGYKDSELIARGSPLWGVIGYLEDGQLVRFDGEMIYLNRREAVQQSDVRALTQPSFELRFKQIEALP
jgi:hypothetical protein